MKTQSVHKAFVLGMILGVCSIGLDVFASESKSPKPDKKTEKAEKTAVPEFVPLGKAQLEETRKEAFQRANALSQELNRQGANGDNWRKYLKLDATLKELNGKDNTNLDKLDDTYSRLDRNYEGLELPQFVKLKKALGCYLNTARAIDNPEIEAAYRQLVEKTLPEQIELFKKNPTPAVAHNIGYALGWLTDFQQAKDLVRRTRKHFARSNVFVEISRNFLAAGMERPVNETGPINDVILGTSIRGTGKTKGNVTIELIPCKDKAILKTIMKGTTETDNTGYNGPAVIRTTGVTKFEASKQMIATADGIKTKPATSKATTSTTINGINTRRPAMQRTAWQRAQGQKANSERIAAEHAQQRINQRMDTQGDKSASDANGRYEKRFRKPLQRRKVFAEELVCSTTKDKVLMRALRAAYNQLAAPNTPPELAEPADIAMQIHQSVVNNSAYTMLAGRAVTEEEFLKTVKDIFGEVPENLQPEKGKAPWTIEFADREPFTITCENGGYTLSLHAVGFERDGTHYPGMNISAKYKIEHTDKGFVAVRQGELTVYPPGFVKGSRKLSGREQTLRKMLRSRFDKMFSKEIVPDGYLEFKKGNWKKIGRVPMTQWTTQDGWMTMAWKLPPKESK